MLKRALYQTAGGPTTWGNIAAALWFCWFLAAVPPQVYAAEVVDRIVAVVNDDIILLSDLMRILKPYADRIQKAGYPEEREKEMLAKVRGEILGGLVDERITDQEVRRIGVFVSEKEVGDAIDRIKKTNRYSDADFEKGLKAEGLTMEAYRQRIKDQILRNKLVNREVKSKIVVTQEDVRKHYESHPEQYGGETRYHLRNLMIRVEPSATEEERAAARKRMEDILSRLRAGESFDKTGTIGKDLGFIGFGTLAPQLQEALRNAEPGSFTPVLDTDQGYQLFFVQDIAQSQGKPFEAVAEDIERELYEDVVNQKFRSWVEDLRKRSSIKIVE